MVNNRCKCGDNSHNYTSHSQCLLNYNVIFYFINLFTILISWIFIAINL